MTSAAASNLSILRGESQDFPNPKEEPHLLHRLFELGMTKTDPSTMAVLAKETSLTYYELDTLSSRLARGILKRANMTVARANGDGDFVVAVMMVPSATLIATLLAVWKSGAATLPLDTSFPEGRVKHILGEAQPLMVITDDEGAGVHGWCNIAVSYQQLLQDSNDLPGTPLADKETFTGENTSLALVLYTSGSTGVPKGVRLPHRVLLNRLRWQWRVLPYGTSESVCVFKTALTFVDSVSELWGPLLNGRTVLVVPSDIAKDPERLVPILDHHKAERLVLVPSLLRAILLYLKSKDCVRKADGNQSLQTLRYWVCGGEPMSAEVVALFFERFTAREHVLCNVYGSTEVMGDVTYYLMNEAQPKDERIPIGRPLDNTIIYLLDNEGRPVVKGEVGELFVSGFNLAEGYVNGRDPDRFVANPMESDPAYSRLYRTGDFARVSNDVILYEGRTDSQVKVSSYRVDLSEVEKAVNEVPGVDKGVVLCYQPGTPAQALLAFVTTSSKLRPHEIEETLKKTLASYQLPLVMVLDQIPLLVNGKVDRQNLLHRYEQSFH